MFKTSVAFMGVFPPERRHAGNSGLKKQFTVFFFSLFSHFLMQTPAKKNGGLVFGTPQEGR